MMSNALLNVRAFLTRNLVPFVTFPLITLFIVFIYYGSEIDHFIGNHPEKYRFYELVNLTGFIRQISNIPLHVKTLVVDMVYLIYIIYIVWLIVFAFNSLYKLARKEHNHISMAIEYFILFFIFFLIINPGMPLAISIFGFILFVFWIIIFSVYFLYYSRLKHEEV